MARVTLVAGIVLCIGCQVHGIVVPYVQSQRGLESCRKCALKFGCKKPSVKEPVLSVSVRRPCGLVCCRQERCPSRSLLVMTFHVTPDCPSGSHAGDSPGERHCPLIQAGTAGRGWPGPLPPVLLVLVGTRPRPSARPWEGLAPVPVGTVDPECSGPQSRPRGRRGAGLCLCPLCPSLPSLRGLCPSFRAAETSWQRALFRFRVALGLCLAEDVKEHTGTGGRGEQRGRSSLS